jgi:hypothetical protein
MSTASSDSSDGEFIARRAMSPPPIAGRGLASACAAALLVLSLGLPWSEPGEGAFSTGSSYVPGFCYTSYDYDGYASTNCDPGSVIIGIYYPGTSAEAAAGRSHPARFGMAAALALLAMAVFTKRPALLLPAGIVVALFTGLSSGIAISQAGIVAAWLAAGLLIWSGASARRTTASIWRQAN